MSAEEDDGAGCGCVFFSIIVAFVMFAGYSGATKSRIHEQGVPVRVDSVGSCWTALPFTLSTCAVRIRNAHGGIEPREVMLFGVVGVNQGDWLTCAATQCIRQEPGP